MCIRDSRGAAQLRALFWSDWDWRRALSEAVRRTFDIPATVNVLADWPFAMKRQEDRDRGCIPACAISVVDHEGAGLDMTEEQLVEAMQRVGGTGFERLREVLAGVAAVSYTHLRARSRHGDRWLSTRESRRDREEQTLQTRGCRSRF